MCAKAGDTQLLDTFIAGKDLYSEIAAVSFGYSYEECKEFNPDGTTNKEGKERRTHAKSILLGILYGRGIESIAEQLHCSREKAQTIKDKVFKGFPAIKDFEKSSIEMAQDLGYVDTVCGRKRRLVDMQLPEYEFTYTDKKISENADLLDFDNEETLSNEVPEYIQNKYIKQLNNARFGQKKQIIQKALQDGIKIKDNGGFIAQATRQCVNSRIQGSAADLTKLAMIKLNNNEELKKLGFRMLIPVHDEIIAECPKENVNECSKLLADTMCKAAEEILNMPISCDVALTDCWYGDTIKEGLDMIKVWVGPELEGNDIGVDTLFVKSTKMLNTDFVIDFIEQEKVKRVYFGAGRTDFYGIDDEDKLKNYCELNDIEVVVEIDANSFVAVPEWFKVIICFRNNNVKLNPNSLTMFKVDSFEDVWVVDSSICVVTNLNNLNGDTFSSDKVLFEE